MIKNIFLFKSAQRTLRNDIHCSTPKHSGALLAVLIIFLSNTDSKNLHLCTHNTERAEEFTHRRYQLNESLNYLSNLFHIELTVRQHL